MFNKSKHEWCGRSLTFMSMPQDCFVAVILTTILRTSALYSNSNCKFHALKTSPHKNITQAAVDKDRNQIQSLKGE